MTLPGATLHARSKPTPLLSGCRPVGRPLPKCHRPATGLCKLAGEKCLVHTQTQILTVSSCFTNGLLLFCVSIWEGTEQLTARP